jgi:hypothetical protein
MIGVKWCRNPTNFRLYTVRLPDQYLALSHQAAELAYSSYGFTHSVTSDTAVLVQLTLMTKRSLRAAAVGCCEVMKRSTPSMM